MEPNNESKPPATQSPSGLDARLASLMNAIKEDWDALEVAEVDGALVVRVKGGEKTENRIAASRLKQTKKLDYSAQIGFGRIRPAGDGINFVP